MKTTRMSRIAVLAALTWAAAPLAPWPSEALATPFYEVVRLRTGETLKGRLIMEKSNEAVAVFEDYVSGAIREIAWPAMEEADKTKIQVLLGIVYVGAGHAVETPCVLVVYKLNVGTDDVRGVVQSEDGTSLVLKTAGGLITIPKASIVSREDMTCDATDVYTPDELAAKEKADKNPQNSREWFAYAQYCEAVGAYAQAKEAYEIAATDPEFLNREVAATKVTQLTALLKDQDALKTIRDLKTKLASYLFVQVRAGLDKFGEKHPDASKAVLDKVEALKGQWKQSRETYFASEAGKNLVKAVEKLIVAKVKDKEAQFTEIQAWAKKELADQAMLELAKILQGKDESVTPEDTGGFWKNRPKKTWWHATYGKGTFVAFPPLIKPPQNRNQPSSGGGNRSGPTVNIPIPKAPTRDSWWAAENTEGRKQWMLAYFVENSGLFDVAPKHEKSTCPQCEGSGIETKSLSGGSSLQYLCTRCAGAQQDQAVKYR